VALEPFQHLNTTGQPGGSTMLDRVIDSLVKTFDSLKNVVLNDALVQVRLVVTDTNVYHGLGHVPKSWELLDNTGAATVFRTAPMNDKFVTLRASATTDVLIRFT
jgi:hypothetical protein